MLFLSVSTGICENFETTHFEYKLQRFYIFNINCICTRTEFKLPLWTLPPSPHTPYGLNTILTVGFKDDLKSLKAATDSFMNGLFFFNCLHQDQHILEIPLVGGVTAEDSRSWAGGGARTG